MYSIIFICILFSISLKTHFILTSKSNQNFAQNVILSVFVLLAVYIIFQNIHYILGGQNCWMIYDVYYGQVMSSQLGFYRLKSQITTLPHRSQRQKDTVHTETTVTYFGDLDCIDVKPIH